MNTNADVQIKYDRLLLNYLESQAFGYVLASIIFITEFSQYKVLFGFGWLFVFTSVFCLLAPVLPWAKKQAVRFNKWLQGGLFVAASAFVMIDGWFGALKIKNQVLFWVLVAWIFILIFASVFGISKRLGVFKFIAFFLAAFGLFMTFLGYGLPFQIIAAVGLVLSIPVLNEIMYEKMIKQSSAKQ